MEESKREAVEKLAGGRARGVKSMPEVRAKKNGKPGSLPRIEKFLSIVGRAERI
jgi:hypothetical protein